MLDIILSIICISLVYKAYENGGREKGLSVKIAFSIIDILLSNSFSVLISIEGVIFCAINLISLIVINFIEYWIYERTHSFITWFLSCIILEFISLVAVYFLLSKLLV